MATVLPNPTTKDDAAWPGKDSTPEHWREALDTCENLELLQPDDIALVFYKGRALRELGQDEAAIATFQCVLKLDPKLVSAHEQLGMIYREHGDMSSAQHHLVRTAELNPSDPHIHLALGDLYREQGNLDTAIIHWRHALDINPHFTPALHCLGVALDHKDQLEEALDCHRCVAEQMPDLSENHRYLAMTQTDLDQLKDALASTERALQLAPKSAEALWQRFFIRALRGDFPGAWEDYECRFRLQNRTTPARDFSQPRWQGEPLTGRTILIHAEQGLGDTLQMVRYLPLVAQRGGRLLLWCPPTLAPLLRGLPDVDQVFSDLDPATAFDCHLPMMSLPGIFGTTLDNLPTVIPYLEAPDTGVCPLPTSPAGTLRVGLAWDGSHSLPIDRRSVPPEALESILDVPGIAFYSLQVGPAAQAVRKKNWDKKIFDLSSQLIDFRATAAAAMQLDLIICLDSAVAHLAGALGRPTWLMLSATPDWRWRREGSRCPWYPTMRIFRQTQAGNWAPMIDKICHALRQYHPQTDGKDDKLRLLKFLERLRGQPQSARPLIQSFLAQHPEETDVWNLLGTTCFELDQLEEAQTAFDKALALQPHYPEAHYNRGNTYYAAHQFDDAHTAWHTATQQDSEMTLAHYNLGLLAQEQQQPDEAIEHYLRALAIEPYHAEAGLNLAEALREADRLNDAIEYLQQFRKIHPQHPDAPINLAAMLTSDHRLDEAGLVCQEAVALNPESTKAWNNQGALYYRRGKYEVAHESFQKALILDPDHADASYNLGIQQLLLGDYKNGFKNYEARWQTSNPIFAARTPCPLPPWRGEPLRNQSLLVRMEQGQGDMIQFARFLPLLAQRGIRVVLECHKSLWRLLEPMDSVERLIPKDSPKPNCTAYCALMGLPQWLGITLDNLPSAPYLPKVKPANLPSARCRVGLAWAGNPEHSLDRERSLGDPAILRPLLDLIGIQFYSLQVDTNPFDNRVANLREQIKDFADTAAMINSLDLVITVDTAVAHLAGAMGRPTWLLLAQSPDWRWLLDRADSPWYPTMGLFRQRRAGDWAEVVDRLTAALAQFAKR